jgi:type IV secretory pathway TrbL component
MGPVMRMAGAAAVVMALLVGTASAEELTAASSRAIVERQFDAFERDDGQAAYALAAPTIKEIFSDAGHFMAMVRDHYAPVYRHRSADFGAFKVLGDEATLEATLVDNDNVVWTALYSFRRGQNGDWLISGCVLAKAEASAI